MNKCPACGKVIKSTVAAINHEQAAIDEYDKLIEELKESDDPDMLDKIEIISEIRNDERDHKKLLIAMQLDIEKRGY